MVVMRPTPVSGVNKDDVRNIGLFSNTIDHSKQKLIECSIMLDCQNLVKARLNSIENAYDYPFKFKIELSEFLLRDSQFGSWGKETGERHYSSQVLVGVCGQNM